MHSLYVDRLKDIGIRKTINKTRLKEKLLEAFPTVHEQSLGQNIVFVFGRKYVMSSDALVIRDFSEDALILVLFLRGHIVCMDQEPMDFHASRHTIGCPQYGNLLAKQHPPIHIRITLKCSHHATK